MKRYGAAPSETSFLMLFVCLCAYVSVHFRNQVIYLFGLHCHSAVAVGCFPKLLVSLQHVHFATTCAELFSAMVAFGDTCGAVLVGDMVEKSSNFFETSRSLEKEPPLVISDSSRDKMFYSMVLQFVHSHSMDVKNGKNPGSFTTRSIEDLGEALKETPPKLVLKLLAKHPTVSRLHCAMQNLEGTKYQLRNRISKMIENCYLRQPSHLQFRHAIVVGKYWLSTVWNRGMVLLRSLHPYISIWLISPLLASIEQYNFCSLPSVRWQSDTSTWPWPVAVVSIYGRTENGKLSNWSREANSFNFLWIYNDLSWFVIWIMMS